MKKLLLLYTAVFVLLLPISLGIHYISNDEWVHYATVKNFLHGKYILHYYLGSTFYVMGFMATVFARVFGIAMLPVLTLLVSVSAVYIFNLILYKILKLKLLDSFLISLALLFNPLFVYSAWGFMTENYLLLFFLISAYYYLIVTESFDAVTPKKLLLYLNLGNLFAVLGFFVKQTSAITIVASAAFFTLKAISSEPTMKRRYLLLGAHQFAVFTLLMTYHLFFFPKTDVSWETHLALGNLFYVRYLFSLFFIVGIYVGSFAMPFAITYLSFFPHIRKWWFWALLAISLVVVLTYFKPTIRWNDAYFYMQNVLQKKGFFVENLHGHKFSFGHSKAIYFLADTFSKVLAVWVGLTLLFKKRLSFSVLYIIVYTLALSLSPAMFDRYLLPVIATSLIFFAKEIKGSFTLPHKIPAIIFLVSLLYYSYNLSADYIITNNYVWQKASELSAKYNIPKGNIVATSAWGYETEGTRTKIDYKFTYDGPQTKEYRDTLRYTLVESKKITFPLSFWIKPYIYLYKVEGTPTIY